MRKAKTVLPKPKNRVYSNPKNSFLAVCKMQKKNWSWSTSILQKFCGKV